MTWHAARFLFVQAVLLLLAAAIAFAGWAFAHRGHRLLRIHPRSAARVIIGVAVAGLALWSFTNILQGVLTNGRVIEADRRLHNTLRLFHSEPLHRFYSSISNVASTAFVGPVAIALAALFWKHRRTFESRLFLLAIAGSTILGVILKYAVKRPRPPDAAGLAVGPSFPSGHSLAAVGLYGILAFLLAREKPRRAWHTVAIAILVAIVILVPISRVYLGVHWLYDTVASLDIGIAWLACLTMLVRFRPDGTTRDAAPTPLRPREFALTTALVVGYAIVLGAIDVQREARPSLRAPVPASEQVLHAFPAQLRKTSEDLIGGPMEPLSFIFVGSADDLRSTFGRAGWYEAQTPSGTGLAAELWAVILDRPDPRGPATPAYYAEQPQDFTFERSGTANGSIRQRHHIRIWRWSYCLAPQCTTLWVATCSFDMGVKFVAKPYVITHRIDPQVDREREFVAQTLRSAGAKDVDFITVTGPARGKNAGGDAFTTDGRAHVLDVRRDSIFQRSARSGAR